MKLFQELRANIALESMKIYVREEIIDVQADKRGGNHGKFRIRSHATYVDLTQVPHQFLNIEDLMRLQRLQRAIDQDMGVNQKTPAVRSNSKSRRIIMGGANKQSSDHLPMVAHHSSSRSLGILDSLKSLHK